MPNRYIRASAIESRSVNALSWQGEVFYRRLLNVVDDFGRFTAEVDLIRVNVFPRQLDKVSLSDTERLLAECQEVGLVFGYKADGKHCIVLNNWEKGRAKHSEYPAPPIELIERMKTYVYRCKHMNTHAPGTGTGTDSDSDSDSDSGKSPELPSESEAIAQTVNAGIPEDFTRYVHQDWFSRQGKDAGGVLVKFLPYVTKRWAREQVEWKAKTHKGKNENNRPNHADRNAGTYNANASTDDIKRKVR